jgi:hypothetical protein
VLVSFRLGWLFFGSGLAAGAVAAFILVGSVGSAVNDVFFRDPCATPCTEVRNLDKGQYLVFEQTGRSRSIGPLSTTTQGPATITPGLVTVTSETGQTLDVVEPGTSQTIDRNGDIYRGAVSFHVSEPGRYRVSIDAPRETRILVAPGLGRTFLKALPGLVVAGLGFVSGMAGLVVLIIAWTRQRNTRTNSEANADRGTQPRIG